jgi:hypothetical protein
MESMTFLRARHVPETENFWWDLRFDIDLDTHVPDLLRELAAGERAVRCDRDRGAAALAWARAQPYWPAHLPGDRAVVYMLGRPGWRHRRPPQPAPSALCARS